MPPHMTRRKTTPNLNTKNNQNCQKIKLYGSPTTKELKKKYSSRLVDGVETGSQGGEEVMKSKDLHPRFLYPVKLSLRMEGQIKCCGGALSPQSAASTVDENKSTKT